MSLEHIGIYAEVVGALAVVATLIFLALELRSNRKATESASMDSLSAGFNMLNSLVIENNNFAAVYVAGLADPKSLVEPGRTQFAYWGQSLMNVYTTVKKYRDSGALPENEWARYSTGMAVILNTPGGKWLSENIAIDSGVLEEIAKFHNPEANFAFSNSAYIQNNNDNSKNEQV